jgi:hypothetical protein
VVLEATKLKIKAPTGLVSGENCFYFQNGTLLKHPAEERNAVSSHGRKGERAIKCSLFLEPFYNGVNHIHEVKASIT